MESFWTVWKVFGQTGKFLDCLEGFGQSGKFPNNLESFKTNRRIPDDLKTLAFQNLKKIGFYLPFEECVWVDWVKLLLLMMMIILMIGMMMTMTKMMMKAHVPFALSRHQASSEESS